MLAFALNPSVVLHATRWGQTDSIPSFLVLVALLCANSRSTALSWFLLSLAAATKPQALLFAPLLLVLTWKTDRWGGLLKVALATASTAIVVMSPLIHAGTWKKALEYFAALARYHPWTTANALNLWWVLGLGERFPDTGAPWDLSLPVIGPLTYRTIGFSFLAAALLFVLWRLFNARDEGDIWAIAAYAAFTFFMLPTKIHENYVYAVFPLLAMAFFVGRPLVVLYVILSCTWLVNNVMGEPIIIDFLDASSIGFQRRTLWDLGMMLAALANTAIFGYWTAMLCRMKGGQPAATRVSPDPSARRR